MQKVNLDLILPLSFLPLIFLFWLSPTISASEFVGSETCINCHQEEYKLWQGSHHDMAMKHASKDSVMGNFENISEKTSTGLNRFFRRENQYWVNIAGPDGKHHDYQIKYTFGFEPLQQYMVEFEDGRIQLIPYAWDSRPETLGGQRWFNLYPEYTKEHQEFFWTNTGQNWNYMCADCHSTNVKKNFDLKKNRYNTTFSEINVACEACHGPASDHIEWSKNTDTNNDQQYGFDRRLKKPVTKWTEEANNPTLQADQIHESQQNLMCAQCHSRRTQISDNDYVSSGALGNRYLINLISEGDYYVDGQIYDEVYVYGSFLQSKMNKKGVSCSNCHDPHSAKLVLPKETLCLQCHKASFYNTPAHHHHSEKSSGALCVNCHMPETTYMQVDQRADHSWHSPRPELSSTLATPDACLSCHQNKNSQWSIQHTKDWYPHLYEKSTSSNQLDFARAFSLSSVAAEFAQPQLSARASRELTKISQDNNFPNIIRASALTRMQALPDQNSYISIARATKSENEHIRLGAIHGALNIPPTERWQLLASLLTDEVLVIRSEAAAALAPIWQVLDEQQKSLLRIALEDYISIQDFNADRGFAHTNRGNIFTHLGRNGDAQKAYEQSMRIEPGYAAAYINKAELYRRLGNEDKNILTLKRGINAQPEDGELYYHLGLSMIRTKDKAKASDYLRRATQISPQNANFFYVLALSLVDSQPSEAQKTMGQTYKLSQNPRHLFALCEMQIKQKSFQARQCLNRLSKVAPAEVVEQLRKEF